MLEKEDVSATDDWFIEEEVHVLVDPIDNIRTANQTVAVASPSNAPFDMEAIRNRQLLAMGEILEVNHQILLKNTKCLDRIE
jgi:hypothetical protein